MSSLFVVVSTTDGVTKCLGTFDMIYKALGFIMDRICSNYWCGKNFTYDNPEYNDNLTRCTGEDDHWIYRVRVHYTDPNKNDTLYEVLFSGYNDISPNSLTQEDNYDE